MQVTVHGEAGGRVRNDFTRGSQDDSPEVQLVRARSRVAELERKHSAAKATFKAAVEDDGCHDLQALKSNVARLAHELDAAGDELTRLEGIETNRKLNRLPKLIEETRAKRDKFIQLYRAACAALGDYCGSVGEAMDLVNLEMRVNALNYSPHRSGVLELARMPRPLEGFAHTPVTHVGYDWKIVVVPVNSSVER